MRQLKRNRVLKLLAAAVLCVSRFLHYSLANSFPFLYLCPLCVYMFGFLLVVPRSACFPKSGAICFPINDDDYGLASYSFCISKNGLFLLVIDYVLMSLF